jgi:hypothetical protein
MAPIVAAPGPCAATSFAVAQSISLTVSLDGRDMAI